MSKLFVSALVLATAVSATSLTATEEAAFAKFTQSHKKVYKNVAEASFRKRVFAENMRKAAEIQATNPLATFGANKFADLTAEEFKAFAGAAEYFKQVKARRAASAPIADMFTSEQITAGASIDYREKGVVGPMKDQGMCGSCWAFSTISNIESAWALANNNTFTILSEQELTSCDTRNGGCDGGFMTDAFQWLLENRGGWISTYESYPYESYWGTAPACKESGLTKGAKISAFKELPQNETQIAQFVLTKSPVAIGVDATAMQFYFGGIMTNCPSTEANHAVNIVGFDDTNVPPYWIIRNSWGASWGEGGYIRLAKGSNQCLVQDFVSTALI